MPRPKRFSPDALVECALPVFWRHGYATTSVDDLTRHTRASRQAIYTAFPEKRALLLACLEVYRDRVVTPAFAQVERTGAGLGDIAAYFEQQIAAAEAEGLPGAGCLFANLAVECADRDAAIGHAVRAHFARLRKGFANALRGASGRAPAAAIDDTALLLATTAQGLWLTARVTSDAAELRRGVAVLLGFIEGSFV